MANDFAVRIRRDDDGATLVVTGIVDLGTGDRLFDAVAGALAGHRQRWMTIDLGGVRLLDGAGVGVLLAARHRVHANGAGFRVVRATGLVQQALEITGVLDLLDAKSGAPHRSRSRRAGGRTR